MSYSLDQETLIATYNGVQYQPKTIDGVKVAATETDCIEYARSGSVNNAWQSENGYKLDRARAYPSIADQLDQIYHEGIDAWKETIAAVKAEYPKP